MSDLTVTHLEYHPAGSEATALRASVVGYESGKALVIRANGEVQYLNPGDFDSRSVYLFELQQPVEWHHAEPPSAVVVGPALLHVLEYLPDESYVDGVVSELKRLPPQPSGFRVFLSTADLCQSLAELISASLHIAVDAEVREGRSDGPFAFMCWRLAAAMATTPTRGRVERGVYLLQRAGRGAELERLIIDATLFDDLTEAQCLRWALEYGARQSQRQKVAPVSSRVTAPHIENVVTLADTTPGKSLPVEWVTVNLPLYNSVGVKPVRKLPPFPASNSVTYFVDEDKRGRARRLPNG